MTPGKFLKQCMEERNIDLVRLAFVTGLTETLLNEILRDNCPISFHVAKKLTIVFKDKYPYAFTKISDEYYEKRPQKILKLSANDLMLFGGKFNPLKDRPFNLHKHREK